jgi:hypothetical protein
MTKIKILVFFCLVFLIEDMHAQTNISGGIYSNTFWTKANSPYIVTGQLVIFQGVSLTIQPGVTVKFDTGASINVRGSMIAKGTETDTIYFTSSSLSPNIGSWSGLLMNWQAELEIEYCHFEYANNLLDYETNGIYSLKHSHFYKNNNAFYYSDGGDLYVDSCLFDYNNFAVNFNEGFSYISNSIFRYNQYSIISGMLIENNIIENGLQGIGNSDGSAYVHIVRNNKIKNNNIGLKVTLGGSSGYEAQISDNIITDNIEGAYIAGAGARPDYYFQNNTVCNKNFNVKVVGYINEDLTNNCWCSSDSAYIKSKIIDGYNDASLGLAKFVPIISCCPPQPITIYGNTSVCPNTSLAFSVDSLPNENYRWTISGGGTILGSGKSITAHLINSGIYNLTCTPFNNYCNGTSKSINITVGTPGPGQIIGAGQICQNDTTAYSVDSIAGVNYRWTVTGGTVFTHGKTASAFWSTPGNYTITCTPYNNCETGTLINKSINVTRDMSNIAYQIYGDTNVKTGSRIIYKISGDTGMIYDWGLNGGGTTTIYGDSISVNWTDPGNYTLNCIPNNICGIGSQSTLLIKVDGSVSGVSNKNILDGLNISPNPNSGLFMVSFSETGNYSLKIYNNTGMEIKNDILRGQENSVRLENIASGIYYVYISTPESRITKKLIIE